MRLDQWLLAARFAKTRAAARSCIEAGRVQVNGQTARASRLVRVGDVVSAPRGGERFELNVQALGTQRGPASVAQTLYEETPASVQARQQQREQQRDLPQFTPPPKRPDRRARRNLLDLLGGQ